MSMPAMTPTRCLPLIRLAMSMVNLSHLQRSKDHPSYQVQHVNRATDHTKNRARSIHRTKLVARERAQYREEFTPESIQPRQPDARHREEDPEERQHRHDAAQPRKLIHVARVITVIHHADDQEHRAGAQAMV